MGKKSNGWPSDRTNVLHQLKELHEDVKENGRITIKILQDVAALKVKSGIWGLVGGSIPVAILLIIKIWNG